MNNGSFDDGSLFGTRAPQSEWERSQIINSGRTSSPSPQGPTMGAYAQPPNIPMGIQSQGYAYSGASSENYDPLAGAHVCLLLFSMLFLFDFYGKFGAPTTSAAWAIQTGGEAAVLILLIVVACLAPAVIGWPIALGILAADLAAALPHQTPWLFKAPLVLPSWWPIWGFELLMVALRVVFLIHGVRMIRPSRVYRA
jgi:hypothetical protein